MPDGHGRSFFRAQMLETRRHQSYEQAFEGEYAFSIDRGDEPPFETYNDATPELQGIIQSCMQDGKSLRAWHPMVAEHGRGDGRPPDRYYCLASGIRSAGGPDESGLWRRCREIALR